jgi:hypothetical protein
LPAALLTRSSTDDSILNPVPDSITLVFNTDITDTRIDSALGLAELFAFSRMFLYNWSFIYGNKAKELLSSTPFDSE